MRLLILIVPLMLAGCKAETPRAEPATALTLKVGHYFQPGSGGRLCVHPGPAPQRATFIAYSQGATANCSASGALQPSGKGFVLVPVGEGGCQIPINREGDRITLGAAPAACDYYCGPRLKLAGQSFVWADTSTAEVEADPLMPDDGAC